jgi:Peptidase family M48
MQPFAEVVIAASPVPATLVGVLGLPSIVRRMPPALASVMLTTLALTLALLVGLFLSLIAFLGTIQMLPADHPHDWSARVLAHQLPVPHAVGIAAGTLAAMLLVRALFYVVRAVVSMRRAEAAVAGFPIVEGLAIVDDPAPHAYAVPGLRPRVVVSTGALRILSARQRRALLVHEDAHLRHYHFVYSQLSWLAAAANPLIRPVARAVDSSLERWADAVAVREVGDSVTVAHALGRVALATDATIPRLAMGAAQHHMVERVRVLLDPPRRSRRGGLLLALGTALCWTSAVAVVFYVHGAIQLAELATH